MVSRLTPLAAVAAACFASAFSAPSAAAGSPGCAAGYAYAGWMAERPAHGVSASLTARSAPNVLGGHVAAWVGVGGHGLGAGGTDAWIQAGLSTFVDGTSRLYIEVAQPGRKPRYFGLRRVAPGETHRVSVYRVRGRGDRWRVAVDGVPASRAFRLPGSRAWAPVATAESWDGGTRVCNSFSYSFRDLRVRTGRAWTSARDGVWITDRGYRLLRRSATGFIAARA